MYQSWRYFDAASRIVRVLESLTRGVVVATWVLCALTLPATAGEPAPAPEAVKTAVERSLVLMQKSAAEYPKHRDCFSCHHQALPVQAFSLAKSRGLAVDDEVLHEALRLTESDLSSAIENYRKGEGQPGGVTRAGYALLTLEVGGWKPDGTTEAVAAFLLSRDKQRQHWYTSSNRPPSEASEFTTTYLAIRGLRSFGRPAQKDQIEERINSARDWLGRHPAKDTEDRVFRLMALKASQASDELITEEVERLRKAQRDDGGWAQIESGESDAYATGSVLVALTQSGGVSTEDPVYRRGLMFLIESQKDDGSWYVKSRSKPFQTYFESGFPHGKDQFISIAATGWATAALLLAVPATR
jgi:hypothetical protein